MEIHMLTTTPSIRLTTIRLRRILRRRTTANTDAHNTTRRRDDNAAERNKHHHHHQQQQPFWLQLRSTRSARTPTTQSIVSLIVMPPSAPLVVRSGAVLIHVKNPMLLDGILASLRRADSASAGEEHTAGPLAKASAQLMADAAEGRPSHNFRSVKDVIFHNKHWLSQKHVRFLAQVQAGYNLARHMPTAELRRRCESIGKVLRGKEHDAFAHGSVAGPARDGLDGSDPHRGSGMIEAGTPVKDVLARLRDDRRLRGRATVAGEKPLIQKCPFADARTIWQQASVQHAPVQHTSLQHASSQTPSALEADATGEPCGAGRVGAEPFPLCAQPDAESPSRAAVLPDDLHFESRRNVSFATDGAQSAELSLASIFAQLTKLL